jgi:hypothetical protein
VQGRRELSRQSELFVELTDRQQSGIAGEKLIDRLAVNELPPQKIERRLPRGCILVNGRRVGLNMSVLQQLNLGRRPSASFVLDDPG